MHVRDLPVLFNLSITHCNTCVCWPAGSVCNQHSPDLSSPVDNDACKVLRHFCLLMSHESCVVTRCGHIHPLQCAQLGSVHMYTKPKSRPDPVAQPAIHEMHLDHAHLQHTHTNKSSNQKNSSPPLPKATRRNRTHIDASAR